MQSIDILKKLQGLGVPCFQTRDAVACLNMSTANASKTLKRLAVHNHLIHIYRGLWAFRENLDLLSLAEYLTLPFPSYISLQTALYHHGMISQLPTIVYAVSLARTKKFSTPVGEFSIHHVDEKFFFGFELLANSLIKMATPEKALIDVIYLSPAKTRLFYAMPEIELPKKFNFKIAKSIIASISSPLRRTMVENRFTKLREQL